jgi:four helix bundle protein
MHKAYRGYKDLHVYNLAYQMALEIHKISKNFPLEEKYSLTDQIRRASRSIPANLAEAWKKRYYPKTFFSKLIDSAGEAGEVEVWLDFSKDFGYISEQQHEYFMDKFAEINKMLSGMMNKSNKFS